LKTNIIFKDKINKAILQIKDYIDIININKFYFIIFIKNFLKIYM